MARGTSKFPNIRPLKPGEGGYNKSARRYIDTSTGEILSRRQRDKLEHGGLNYEQRAKSSKAPVKGLTGRARYEYYVSRYMDGINKEYRSLGLRELTRAEVKKSGNFKAAYAQFTGQSKRKHPDKSAKGKLAEALRELYIKNDDIYPLGETPD